MLFNHPEFSIQPAGKTACNNDLVLCFQHDRLLMNRQLELPTVSQFQLLMPEGTCLFELIVAKERTYFTLPPFADISIAETDDFLFQEVRLCRSMPYEKASLIMSGWHLWTWYRNNRYCGRCGHEAQPDQKERALRCPSCGYLHFPMIAPAIIVAITCGNKILLARNARSQYPHFALIAGYMEVGETLEHALRREVMEEVGLELDEIHYLEDQPWGLSGSHMFAFHATANDAQPLRIQKSELTEARWFERSELGPKESSISIANELIDRFRLGIL